ncbi:ADP-forming succinate--CoA ligase subunit beta [bacterium CG17_big_fil_post_rev_8_21_14_2_50_64_8]|nr:MAG: ADP-forming succinate--CoA ligase subunit beta [bacterium CG17_big_fil_post_rev_8_21_14_2_50_64_8]PJA75617.1 MAG: ADP-forming succinate--CoA ligase subunit beta [bacterium CG_4_9_14_3_um_filter_65_15]
MNIHEYQAKEIFRSFGLPVPGGKVATSVDEAVKLAEEQGLPVMVKSQVLTGGRGKAGGVKFCEGMDDVRSSAEKILGLDIKGHIVRKVLVTPAVDIASEYYVGMLIDRNTKRILLMASAEGGVEIEQVAKETPELIFKQTIDPRFGLLDHEAMGMGMRLCPDDIKKARQLASAMQKLYKAFVESDASLAEINPFIFTPEGKGHAIDAKVNLDDNALFRHPGYEALRDLDAENPAERAAREAGLSFVKLQGNVGCLVNGAGLAMATMDLVKYYGGQPANFLDIGGSSNPEKVVNALQIILSDPEVKAILFNIFGGITRCDDVAQGIITATKSMDIPVPIVVRLTGTNEEEGRAMLAKTDLIPAATMDEAVQKAIELAG